MDELMMFNYAQLNEQGYCIGVSSLSGDVISDDMILLDEYDPSYMGRKYDRDAKQWTDEYFVPEPVKPQVSEHEKITKEVHETTLVSAEDNLLNMDLLTTIDDKLTLIMEHLGI